MPDLLAITPFCELDHCAKKVRTRSNSHRQRTSSPDYESKTNEMKKAKIVEAKEHISEHNEAGKTRCQCMIWPACLPCTTWEMLGCGGPGLGREPTKHSCGLRRRHRKTGASPRMQCMMKRKTWGVALHHSGTPTPSVMGRTVGHVYSQGGRRYIT